MDFIERFEIENLVYEFKNDMQNSNTMYKIFKYMGYCVEKNVSKMSFKKFVILYGDPDEIYCKEELQILDLDINLDLVSMFCEGSDNSDKLDIFYISIDQDLSNIVFHLCAIIKILDKAVKEKFFCVFKNNDEFCIGANYTSMNDFYGNYIVSRFFDFKYLADFFYWLFQYSMYNISLCELHIEILGYIVEICDQFIDIDYNNRNQNRKENDQIEPNWQRNEAVDSKTLSLELKFIKICSDSSYNYIDILDEVEEEKLMEEMDNNFDDYDDELENILDNYDDELENRIDDIDENNFIDAERLLDLI